MKTKDLSNLVVFANAAVSSPGNVKKYTSVASGRHIPMVFRNVSNLQAKVISSDSELDEAMKIIEDVLRDKNNSSTNYYFELEEAANRLIRSSKKPERLAGRALLTAVKSHKRKKYGRCGY